MIGQAHPQIPCASDESTFFLAGALRATQSKASPEIGTGKSRCQKSDATIIIHSCMTCRLTFNRAILEKITPENILSEQEIEGVVRVLTTMLDDRSQK